ncbi:MAG: hypothetical protein R3B09_11840 [Nannocystaceae bacterium]
MLASAEEVLVLPDDVDFDRVGVDFAWTPTSAQLQRLATTLGALGPGAEVRLASLRHTALLAGPLGTATFRGPAGDDDVAWSGDTSFDLRWSAAEIAGARTAVDLYFGAARTERFTTLLAVDIDFPGDDGILVYPRAGGLYVALSPGARWDGEARIAVAQGLVHRWIGGRLRLDPGGEGPPERAMWFDVGVGRGIAREILVDLGVFGADDLLAEIHRLVGELRTSPLRDQSNDAVAAAAAAGDDDAKALLVARGALFAARLDAVLRGLGAPLRARMRALFEGAALRGARVVTIADLIQWIDHELVDAGAGELQRVLAGSLTLPRALLGECFTAAPRTYTRFDLGFDAARSQAESPPTVRGVRPGGPAAKAGLREGEPLHSVVADRDDPEVPAEVVVERGGQPTTIQYRPRGTSARGDGWRRRPGADPRLCPP